MRRTLLLFFGVGLVASALGCHKTCQHTGGVCDCYPPPVESLLQAPCPAPAGHNVAPASGAYVGAYAPAPYAPTPPNGRIAPSPDRMPILPKGAEQIPVPPKAIEKDGKTIEKDS
jgi:hypothetical protein